MILEKYALPNLIKEYTLNKDRINEHFKLSPKEGYKYRNSNLADEEEEILGLSIQVFMMLLFISFILWVIAIYMLVINWDELEDWAKIIAIGGIVLGFIGPVITIVIVILGKKKNKKNKKTKRRE